jgi:hypothetical protein
MKMKDEVILTYEFMRMTCLLKVLAENWMPVETKSEWQTASAVHDVLFMEGDQQPYVRDEVPSMASIVNHANAADVKCNMRLVFAGEKNVQESMCDIEPETELLYECVPSDSFPVGHKYINNLRQWTGQEHAIGAQGANAPQSVLTSVDEQGVTVMG